MKRPKPVKGLKNIVRGRRPAIQEVVREPTSGGIVFRHGKNDQIEVLLIQDAKDRWTIPKGHIEDGENAKQTAGREVSEETGLKDITVLSWLGKINFRYRRQQSLVLMTTQIYLVRADNPHEKPKKESWMNGIQWFPAMDALDKIEYEDIGKIMLLGLKRIRDQKL